MTELIAIITDKQGAKVKSARELHTYLGVRSRFADWFKNRVHKYGFVEGRDFVTLSKNLESGGRELDYALTLDMAKELAMVERTEKGRQARQYFIEAERTLQKALTSAGSEPALLQLVSQQTQLLADNQQVLARLRSDIDKLMRKGRTTAAHSGRSGQSGAKPRPNAGQLRLPGLTEPAQQLRLAITAKIEAYCEWGGFDERETWKHLYRRLFDVYSFNVHRINRNGSEGMLDAIERYGRLNDLHKLVMAELTYN